MPGAMTAELPEEPWSPSTRHRMKENLRSFLLGNYHWNSVRAAEPIHLDSHRMQDTNHCLIKQQKISVSVLGLCLTARSDDS